MDSLLIFLFKFFWADLKALFFETICHSFWVGELPCGLRRGILSLLPKKDKDLRYLKSWRPVSLLATDYKILAKALAIKLQTVISDIVSNDQVGYIKGRFIGENVRIIEDIINFTTEKDINGLLVLIDFEKAFDTVEWNFLFKSLQAYNFRENYIKWVKLLYSNITSSTINNGFLSPTFKLSRGIRQGCPLSALLFILVAETIALKLKTEKKIQGIMVGETEYKICQMADDTTLFVKSIESITMAIQVFQELELVSGLKLNLDKTEVIPLGHFRHVELPLPKHLCELKINKKAFKTLGIWFTPTIGEASKLNFDDRLKKAEIIINIWKQQSLSWKGKIMVIKSLILSQFSHLFTMIYTPQYILDRLQKAILNFMWDNKPPRIKFETIIAKTDQGGLKLPDIIAFHNAQKISWIKRVHCDKNGKWKNLFLKLGNIDEKILDHKLTVKQALPSYKIESFQYQVLECWYKIKSQNLETVQEIRNEYVFFNKFIVFDGVPISPEMVGVENKFSELKLSQILNSEGKLLSVHTVHSKLNSKATTFHIQSLVAAIPKQWRTKVENQLVSVRELPYFCIRSNNKLKELSKMKNNDIYWEILSL